MNGETQTSQTQSPTWFQDLYENVFGQSGQLDLNQLIGMSPWQYALQRYDLTEQDFPSYLVPSLTKSQIDPLKYSSYKDTVEAGVAPKAGQYIQAADKLLTRSNLNIGEQQKDLQKAREAYRQSTAPVFAQVSEGISKGRQGIEDLIASIEAQAARVKGF